MSRIIEACVAFFEADEWPYERIERLPMVRSRYAGRNGNYDCWFQARPTEQQMMFYSRTPVNAGTEKLTALAEFFTRANYGMVVGNFELDLNDGEMRYKVSADVEGVDLTTTFLKNLSYTAVVTLDRYYPGIMKVLNSDIDPIIAVREIEGEVDTSKPKSDPAPLEKVARETMEKLIDQMQSNTEEEDARRQAERDARVAAVLERAREKGELPGLGVPETDDEGPE